MAKVGVGVGATTAAIVKALQGGGTLHIFDFESKISALLLDFNLEDYSRGVEIVGHGNSAHTRDSYAWKLAKLWLSTGLKLDLAFLDGSHTFEYDAPACCILKEMIKPGGYLIFDDMHWTLAKSPTMNPTVLSRTRTRYSDEQIETPQVAMVVDLFIRPDQRFEEVFLTESKKPSRAIFRRKET